jgi:hypothetical protein
MILQYKLYLNSKLKKLLKQRDMCAAQCRVKRSHCCALWPYSLAHQKKC